ncbi:MAG: SpoIIE family protein phosphatase [Crocinitomicaceae bacterium]|nr:SpoIIE family protein phosphatase [Crocinitomicaceae bacterium]
MDKRQIKWISQTVNFIRNDEGLVEGFLAIAKDITESKNASLRLELYSKQRLVFSDFLRELSIFQSNSLSEFLVHVCEKGSGIIDALNVCIWFNDGDSIKLLSSKEGEVESGVDAVSITKTDAAEFFNNLNAGIPISIVDTAVAGLLPRLKEDYIIPKNIKSIFAAPIRAGGSVWGIVSFESIGIQRDWTEQETSFAKSLTEIVSSNIQLDIRRTIEKKIQESEANFRLLNETIDDVFWLMDLNTKKVIYISPSSKKVLGVDPVEFYHTNNYWQNYILDADKPGIIEAHKAIHVQGYYEIEYRITIENEIRWIAEKSFGIRNEAGEFIKSSGICTDITDRKLKETIIEKQNFDILSSISYAQRIQYALLPDLTLLKGANIDSTIYYKPKDIIGGDFYWFDQVDDKLVVAIGDCTGHGVPGALMTSLGINGLINSVTEQKMTDPASILTYLDAYIFRILTTGNPSDQVKDGMDITVLTIDIQNRSLLFASAARPLISVLDGNITRTEGNRKSIGSSILNEKYVTIELDYVKDMNLFLFSDGMVDQFGGDRKKRLGSKNFYALCLELAQLESTEREKGLETFYQKWAGNVNQTDDMICLILKLK